jgi:hypothetical protein
VEVSLEQGQDPVDLVVAVLREVLEAVSDGAHLRRRRRPSAVLGVEHGVFELRDVELHLEAGDVVEPVLGELPPTTGA